jgi:D-glucosaminate-6-phosphate ammonia-lyase
MPARRTFLESLSSLPIAGALFSRLSPAAPKSVAGRDYFRELGVRTFINAAGTYTAMTSSLMPREVISAIDYASHHFVMLNELHDKVGERIASLLKVEAAMVTSGAAGAMTVGTAGCITGMDMSKVLRLPDLSGMKNEVLIQKSHRFGYDHAVRAAGVKMIEVESAEDIERAAGSQTAMMLFYNNNDPVGKITSEEWVRLGKKLNIPTFNDCSADVPPVENFFRYTKLGFDLVTFSGGKGICGPQSAGMLLGRKDLIAAARLNTSPNGDTIARGMKVNKEEMLGMLVALELFLARDQDATYREWNKRCDTIAKAVHSVPGLKHEVKTPPIANHVPHLHLSWDSSRIRITPREVQKALREGTPSIECNPMTSDTELVFGVWMLQPGEAEVVARRVKELLKA